MIRLLCWFWRGLRARADAADAADADESTRHAIWVIGQTVDRLDPGRTDEIVERRAGRQS